MPSKRVTIIVRCEDLQQRCFIYRYLLKKGFQKHGIDIENSPKGKGAATQWVLQQYPSEVQAHRSGPPSARGLISIIDADVDSVEKRKQQHDHALTASGLASRASTESIAIVVPKRNIETWVHHLLGKPNINEEDSYTKFRGEERQCAPAAEEFARRCPNAMQLNDLPSLRDGCAELQRITL
jgi:hypothetical protein